MRHWILVAFCAFLSLTLAPVFVSRAEEMPKFEQAPPVCGQDPARPNFCGVVERVCLSPPAFVALMKQIAARPVFMGDELGAGSTLLIVMAPDKSIGVFSLENTGRACLLASSADAGEWDKAIIKALFLGNGREIEI